jgi:hypothetical protein
VIKITDLDTDLQQLLGELGKHPKVMVATGARTVFLYVQGRQIQKQVELRIPGEYRELIQVVLTGKIRPAKHEPTSKAEKKRGTYRKRGRS